MAVSDILKDVLPTKWSQWSAAMTTLLVPLAYNVPLILPVSWQAESEVSSFLIRLLLALLTLSIGSSIVFIFVLRELAQEKKKHLSLETKSENQKIALENLQAEIRTRDAEINRLRQENKSLSDLLHAQPDEPPFDVRKF
jgi:hypothetical protein